MSTLYNRNKIPSSSKRSESDDESLKIYREDPSLMHKEQPDSIDGLMNLNSHLAGVDQALSVVDNIVLKRYLTKLSEMSIVSLGDKWNLNAALKDIILFKVDKMVYEKDEYATEKFNTVISALTYVSGSVFMLVDGFDNHTDFYLGVRLDSSTNKTTSSYGETLRRALEGQFPGAKIRDFSTVAVGEVCSLQDHLIQNIEEEVNAISICSGVPSIKNSKGEYTNATFIQGIEKFATAMTGKRYTAIILATNIPDEEIGKLRLGYENVYSQLSAAATHQLAYTTTESLANAYSRSRGVSDSTGTSDTIGNSTSTAHTETHSEQESHSHTESESKENFWGMAAKFADPLMEAGAILAATGVGAPLGAVMMGVGAGAAIGGVVKGKHLSKGDSVTKGITNGHTDGITQTVNKAHTDTKTHTESFNETNGQTSTIGTNKNFTITIQDKHIQEIQKRIDKQLERLSVAESTGLWATCAYFLSYEQERATAESGASIYRSIVQGEQSGVEQSAINTWYSNSPYFTDLKRYICSFSHPVFSFDVSNLSQSIFLPPTNMLSSKEVAIALALPRKSVPGFPVVEHTTLGKEVVRHWDDKDENRPPSKMFEIGCIFDQGISRPNNKVFLDANSLAKHVFVTGSTGCGKSETVYKLIDSLNKAGAKFLIIEPAKGEYKNIFGTKYILGTNPNISNLLKINPFKFTDGVHVLEHIDRLIEIFNVCWPMYAAMPAVLKESLLNAYEDCGWDLVNSTNKYSDKIFPTFSDLIWELETAIELSEYSEEVKSNYKGSLVTRVKSLANGINGEIFSGQEIGDKILFDENVIVDISRIGSQETKALIMGVLIMRLNEYRANNVTEVNSALRHVTIIEEAHNILKRCSQEQTSEGTNVTGKSVELISNAISEMRTYGEGFIIVDQSPGAVDISAIRNTNTKIIMRLPEESDRRIAGKSAAMKDNQIDEIAKLPTGVAVIYQNDWEEPVLCEIERYSGRRLKYEFKKDVREVLDLDVLIVEILKFMLQTKVSYPMEYDCDLIKSNIAQSILPTYVKINVLDAIQEFEKTSKASIWADDEFIKFSRIISGLFGIKQQVHKLAKQPSGYEELTLGLKSLIHAKVKDIPKELDMAIIQSLLRDYSIGDETRLQRYSDWLKVAREQKE